MIKLSIIIPVFNEQDKIARDIALTDQFLSSTANMIGEIIVVDDGSQDETRMIAQKAAESTRSECHIISLNSNRGKGCAVRTGVIKSRGDYVLFADSGVCIPFEQVQKGIDLIRSGQCDIAHASRKLHDCHVLQDQSFYRKICSYLFHVFLVHDIKQLGNLTDTQCGFKVYKGSVARELYSESLIDRFMFDIEIILLALQKKYTIREYPVDWTCDPDSRLKPLREFYCTMKDLIVLKRKLCNCRHTIKDAV